MQPLKSVLMETTKPIERMRIVGGNLALDFVNTRTEPARDAEVLQEYDDLIAWGRRVWILSEPVAARLGRRAGEHPRAANEATARARRLRESLHDLFGDVVAGRSPSHRSTAALRSQEAAALARADLVPGSAGFEWTWADDDDLARPLWPVVHAAVELLVSGPVDRIKACAGCTYLFIDESKNRSRRWCSMEDCGRAEKVRRYVARRATRRKATTNGHAVRVDREEA
jgi:predicted RNA-binding Zn ribbon-like protein